MELPFGRFAPPAEVDFLLEDLQVSPRRPLLICNAAVFTFLLNGVNVKRDAPLAISLEPGMEPRTLLLSAPAPTSSMIYPGFIQVFPVLVTTGRF